MRGEALPYVRRNVIFISCMTSRTATVACYSYDDFNYAQPVNSQREKSNNFIIKIGNSSFNIDFFFFFF